MEDKQFKFKVKLGAFEFEVAGDKNFVEKTMNRYEGRFLPRFQQLMSGIDRPAAPQQQPSAEETQPRTQQHQQQTEQGKQPTQQKHQSPSGGSSSQQARDQQRDQRDQQKESKKDRSKRSRGGRKRNRNNNTWVRPAPELPKDQEVSRAPYIPDDVDETEEAPPAKPEPAPKKEEKKASGQFDGRLRDLFDKISPRTHHEKILVFAYYLQERKNFTTFAANDIRGCYESVDLDPAGNINQVLNHASRTGFLNKTQRGRQVNFSITSKGKHFVEKGLEPGD